MADVSPERTGEGPGQDCKVQSRGPLSVYSLGELTLDQVDLLQRRLVYDVGESDQGGALILCEQTPGITVGRSGSHAHIRLTPEELHGHGWSVQWQACGGGVMLHLPGQVCAYPIVPIDRWGMTAAEYTTRFLQVLLSTCTSLKIPAVADPMNPGILVNQRRLAHLGVAVRHGVTSYGAVMNVTTDLRMFRGIDCDGWPHPMTSAYRASPLPVRVASVRQLLMTNFAEHFHFDRLSIFHSHPVLSASKSHHGAIVTCP